MEGRELIDPRMLLLMVALFSQWTMTTVLLALLVDPNVCVLCSVGLLVLDVETALHRLGEELRWAAYQRDIVRAHDAAMSDTGDVQESGSGIPC